MAKDQNLLGNLSKISGPCGRLLCCLRFEEDFYLEKAANFPEIGDEVLYNEVKMRVFKNDYYNNKIYLTSKDEKNEAVTLEEFNSLEKC